MNSDVHLVISSANAAASRLYREGPTYGIIVISSILRKVSHGPMVIYTAGRGRELTKSNCFSRFSVMLKCWPAEEVEVVDRRMLEGQMLGEHDAGLHHQLFRHARWCNQACTVRHVLGPRDEQ